jgi:hypothetical protein
MEITDLDRRRIKLDIRISLLLSSVFFGGIMLLILIIALVAYCLPNPTNGFLNRFLYIESIFIFLYLMFQWNNLLKYFDLIKGKKVRIETKNYEVKKTKKSTLLITKNPTFKFQIDDSLLPLIDINKTLFFEFTQNSKILLFISNDSKNLLEEIEKENN